MASPAARWCPALNNTPLPPEALGRGARADPGCLTTQVAGFPQATTACGLCVVCHLTRPLKRHASSASCYHGEGGGVVAMLSYRTTSVRFSLRDHFDPSWRRPRHTAWGLSCLQGYWVSASCGAQHVSPKRGGGTRRGATQARPLDHGRAQDSLTSTIGRACRGLDATSATRTALLIGSRHGVQALLAASRPPRPLFEVSRAEERHAQP